MQDMTDILHLDQGKRKAPAKEPPNGEADVVVAPFITTLDTPADRILEAAHGEMDVCIIIGTDKAGNDYFASNRSDAGVVIYHCERAKHKLMKIIDEMSGA